MIKITLLLTGFFALVVAAIVFAELSRVNWKDNKLRKNYALRFALSFIGCFSIYAKGEQAVLDEHNICPTFFNRTSEPEKYYLCLMSSKKERSQMVGGFISFINTDAAKIIEWVVLPAPFYYANTND